VADREEDTGCTLLGLVAEGPSLAEEDPGEGPETVRNLAVLGREAADPMPAVEVAGESCRSHSLPAAVVVRSRSRRCHRGHGDDEMTRCILNRDT
jgi:hypothetical protein